MAIGTSHEGLVPRSETGMRARTGTPDFSKMSNEGLFAYSRDFHDKAMAALNGVAIDAGSEVLSDFVEVSPEEILNASSATNEDVSGLLSGF